MEIYSDFIGNGWETWWNSWKMDGKYGDLIGDRWEKMMKFMGHRWEV